MIWEIIFNSIIGVINLILSSSISLHSTHENSKNKKLINQFEKIIEKYKINFEREIDELKIQIINLEKILYKKNQKTTIKNQHDANIEHVSLSYDNVLLVIFWLCPSLRLK